MLLTRWGSSFSCDGTHKTIKCLLGLQLFWLCSPECERPELPFGDEVNTDVSGQLLLEANKLGLQPFYT